jgi:hypothetical protein
MEHGEKVTIAPSTPLTRTIPPAPKFDPPTQPAGRVPAPARRTPEHRAAAD